MNPPTGETPYNPYYFPPIISQSRTVFEGLIPPTGPTGLIIDPPTGSTPDEQARKVELESKYAECVAKSYAEYHMYAGSQYYEDFKMYGVKSKHHHVDFMEGKIDTDPCDIYEKVSGVKIHHGEPDNHMMKIDHEDDIKLFEAEIISQRRDSKLKELGI
jgi:hypothetical protein